jgi:hypothetical protein
MLYPGLTAGFDSLTSTSKSSTESPTASLRSIVEFDPDSNLETSIESSSGSFHCLTECLIGSIRIRVRFGVMDAAIDVIRRNIDCHNLERVIPSVFDVVLCPRSHHDEIPGRDGRRRPLCQ